MIRLEPGVPLVEVERSGVVESVHSGHIIALGPDGSTVFAAGNVFQPIFGRSSLKPFQAVGLLRSGLDLSPEDLALAAASHSGSDRHRALIATSLATGGFTETDLECPPDLPLGEDERRQYLIAGLSETRLAMNCSGKHAGMLRACLANGWVVSGYSSAGHPLQLHLKSVVADLAGEKVAATGVDGCGAPLFAVSLSGIARGFSRIARATDGPDRQVAEAMRRHPDLVAGNGRTATRLMQGIGGLIAKDGAEGVFAAALPDGGAIACKIDDGAGRAADRAVVAGLRRLGVSAAVLDDLETAPLLGGDERVGSVRPIY
ncbi:asparaginase [Jatrophihabitans sp. DSM 45814]